MVGIRPIELAVSEKDKEERTCLGSVPRAEM